MAQSYGLGELEAQLEQALCTVFESIPGIDQPFYFRKPRFVGQPEQSPDQPGLFARPVRIERLAQFLHPEAGTGGPGTRQGELLSQCFQRSRLGNIEMLASS